MKEVLLHPLHDQQQLVALRHGLYLNLWATSAANAINAL